MEQMKTGYDYDKQVWVIDYVVQKCGHPEFMVCGCNGRKYQGRDVRTI